MLAKDCRGYLLVCVYLLTTIGAIPLASASELTVDDPPVAVFLDEFHVETPMDTSADSEGNIYLSDFVGNVLIKLDRHGREIGRVRVSRPVSVGVSKEGLVYVGSQGEGCVKVFDLSLSFQYDLGAGEFVRPRDIAVGPAGRVFVVDQVRAVVQAYDRYGSPILFNGSPTIGSKGVGDGQFWGPVGVAVGEAAGELYVLDTGGTTSSGGMMGSEVVLNRVNVFGLADGVYLRSFGEFGMYEGKLFHPTQMATDGVGRIYVTDARQWCVHMFSPAGISLGTIQNEISPIDTPSGVGFAGDRLYVASASSGMVQVYGIDGFVDLSASPDALSFTAKVGKPAPAAATVTVSNDGPGTMEWTAAANDGWITLSASGGSVGDAGSGTVDVGVDHAGLAANTSYTGTVSISDGRGVMVEVGVNLLVEEAATLSVDPASLSFAMVEGEANPLAQELTITIRGDSDPLVVPELSAAGGFIQLAGQSVGVDGTGLSAGEYTGSVTVTGAGCEPETVVVPVTLVVTAAVVNTDPGVGKGGSLVVGRGSFPGNDTRIRVLNADGRPTGTDFMAFPGLYGGVNVAVGDVDGDGVGEIVAATTGAGSDAARVAAFEADGTMLVGSGALVFDGSRTGAAVGVGDFDGDGAEEVVVATDDGRGDAEVRVLLYDGAGLVDTGVRFEPFRGRGAVGLGVGDVDGDGFVEVLTYRKGRGGEFRVWDVDTGGGLGSWGVSPGPVVSDVGMIAAVTVVDVTGDGTGEIALIDMSGNIVLRDIFGWIARGPRNEGDPGYGRTGLTLAAADVDGDGVLEMLVGCVCTQSSDEGRSYVGGEVRVLDVVLGGEQGRVEAFADGRGASVAAGHLGF